MDLTLTILLAAAMISGAILATRYDLVAPVRSFWARVVVPRPPTTGRPPVQVQAARARVDEPPTETVKRLARRTARGTLGRTIGALIVVVLIVGLIVWSRLL